MFSLIAKTMAFIQVNKRNNRRQGTQELEVDFHETSYSKFYSSQVQMGSRRQFIDLVWDTKCEWTIIKTKDCLNCQKSSRSQAVYNQENSKDFQRQGTQFINADFGDNFIGNFKATGFSVSDSLKLMRGSNTISLDSYNWLEAINFDASPDSNFEDVHGVIGLARNSEAAELLIPTLFRAGEIDQNMVSIKLEETNQQKKNRSPPSGLIEFGDYSVNNMKFKTDFELVWIDQPKQGSDWVLDFNGFTYKDKTKRYNNKVVIDTMKTGILFPFDVSEQIIEMVIPGAGKIQYTEFDTNLHMSGPCQDSFYQSFYLEMSGHSFEITPERIVGGMNKQVSSDDSCRTAIGFHNKPEVILGTDFMLDYMMIFDYGENRLGIAPSHGTEASISKSNL